MLFLARWSDGFYCGPYHQTATYPLDLTKTRLQIQGEAMTKAAATAASANTVKQSVEAAAAAKVNTNSFDCRRVCMRTKCDFVGLLTINGVCFAGRKVFAIRTHTATDLSD